jgi:hypothetical protein
MTALEFGYVLGQVQLGNEKQAGFFSSLFSGGGRAAGKAVNYAKPGIAGALTSLKSQGAAAARAMPKINLGKYSGPALGIAAHESGQRLSADEIMRAWQATTSGAGDLMSRFKARPPAARSTMARFSNFGDMARQSPEIAKSLQAATQRFNAAEAARLAAMGG